MEKLSYGDLTGDGKDEAILIMGFDMSPGNGSAMLGLVYTLQNGQAVLLTKFEGGGTRGVIFGARVENGLLIVDAAEPLDDPDCCPEHYRSISYRWDGSHLTEVGRSAIKKAPKK